MASKSLRRFDVQAKVSFVLSVLGGVALVGLVYLIVRNYVSELGAIKYAKAGKYPILFYLTAGAALLFSFLGAALGFSSAGQRRNEMQRRSWVAFFLGTLFCAIIIICVFMFRSLKMPL